MWNALILSVLTNFALYFKDSAKDITAKGWLIL